MADSLREENEALKKELKDLMSHADAVGSKVEGGVELRLTDTVPALSSLAATSPFCQHPWLFGVPHAARIC